MAGNMAFDLGRHDQAGGCWATVAAIAAADSSATHATAQALANPRAPVRIVADAIHLIGMLHGRYPGIIDHAAERAPDDGAFAWLTEASAGFAAERSYLAKLVSVVGPIPSTPGQAESEAAVAAQRHALDMLSTSDRAGCAVGAAVALVIDWRAMRVALDVAADRFGLEPPPCALPDRDTTATMVAAMAVTPAIERAIAFGAQQVLAQHRGLWDLIDARASARGDR